jgi:hypothetical protein
MSQFNDAELNAKIEAFLNKIGPVSTPFSVPADPSGIPANATQSESNLLKRIYTNMVSNSSIFPYMQAYLQANEQNHNASIPDILTILNNFQANISSHMSEYSDVSTNGFTSMTARIIVLDEKSNVCYDSANASITYKAWNVVNRGNGLVTNVNNFAWSNALRIATMNPTPGYGFEIVASFARYRIGYFCAFPVNGPGNNYGSVIFSVY